jgi:hypothetical protein
LAYLDVRKTNRAIDELLVELPDPALVSLLIAEIAQVDGVDVEDVRPADEGREDPRLRALETAAKEANQRAKLQDYIARNSARASTASRVIASPASAAPGISSMRRKSGLRNRRLDG